MNIHDQMKIKAQLAFLYAEDGAFNSAASIFRDIADMYEKRHNESLGQLEPAASKIRNRPHR